MWYRFRARKSDGSTENGYLNAKNIGDAKKQLTARFVAILELTEQAKSSEKPFKVPPDVISGFFRRLAVMLHAGMPLAQSLDYLSSSESDAQLAKALEKIYQEVSTGQRFSVAMCQPQVKNLFSNVMVGLVQLGESTGALVDSLMRIAELCETQLRLRRAVVSALTYPAFLFAAILAMGLFFTLVLAPGDANLFASLGSELPWPTQVMINLSSMLRNPFWVVGVSGGLIALVWLFFWQLRRNDKFRLKIHRKILRIPIVGPLVRKTVSAQMLYVISCALQVGMTTTDALKLAREVCINLEFRQRFDDALRAFREGDDLSDALYRYEVFPHLVITMIQMGLEVGNLEIVLSKISVLYEEDVTQSLTSATQLAEPILLAFAGAMSAFLALATLLPIINVVNTL
ncbi:MAG: type II secretion system F family protein [Candidatus Eremiobacteraeota bacterium]|nr:type II secretion system F family protein [Candidatus Eremiobacteraeota bacterium]